MATVDSSLVRGPSLADVLARALGVGWALVMVWVLVVGDRERNRVFSSRFECGTDPEDILRTGETLDEGTLRIIIDAHCANARYLSDERIELRYGGAPYAVETRKLVIAGDIYYEIVSVGGAVAR
jgi:phytoene/squalene synthetase